MSKRRRGLGGVAYTKTDLKAQAKACGSHYFDPSTMRFFKSRLIAVYPGGGKTYFVEGKGGGSWGPSVKRHYTIGVFKGCRVESLGQGVGRRKETGVYKTSAKAKKIAAAIASKAGGYGTTLKLRKRRRR